MRFSRRRLDDAAANPADDLATDDLPLDEDEDEATASPVSADSADDDTDEADGVDDDDDDEDDDEDDSLDDDEWDEYDRSQDWRDDGPFDIEEVDLQADDVMRVDLGALIVTPSPGMRLQLLADQKSGLILHLIGHLGDSGIKITLFAAPATDGYASEIRHDILRQAPAGATVEQARGPFGTEIRRVIKTTTPQGQEGFAPLRDWYVDGPRWVLNGQLLGQAALDTAKAGPAVELEEFFRNIVVRRGSEAKLPGQVIALTPPATAVAAS
ncbi:MAG: DUF3710 domain-containing protein [Propionibacteriaceae bacterium]|jgi:hypothetical protein|nr:DUF3710 domain-containing protein [Propionibacteriaceae bacterium]